jgi:ABC-2 type transport system permease protein
MNNIWAICKREIRTYFTSPIAYVAITVFLIVTGFFFYTLIQWFNLQSMQMARNPQYYQQLNINQMVYSPLFHNISIILLFLVPILTMRLFAEEKKTKTEELLYTSPVSISQIILGKYFASLFVLLVMLLLNGLLSLFVFAFGNPEILPLLNGYLGLFLMGAAFMALGIFFSSLTENQIIAASLGFGFFLLFFVLNWASQFAGGIWRSVLNYLSFFQHFDDMTRGILDTTDIVYYLSLVTFGLFLTHSVIQSRRWR